MSSEKEDKKKILKNLKGTAEGFKEDIKGCLDALIKEVETGNEENMKIKCGDFSPSQSHIGFKNFHNSFKNFYGLELKENALTEEQNVYRKIIKVVCTQDRQPGESKWNFKDEWIQKNVIDIIDDGSMPKLKKICNAAKKLCNDKLSNDEKGKLWKKLVKEVSSKNLKKDRETIQDYRDRKRKAKQDHKVLDYLSLMKKTLKAISQQNEVLKNLGKLKKEVDAIALELKKTKVKRFFGGNMKTFKLVAEEMKELSKILKDKTKKIEEIKEHSSVEINL